ncbi:MAG: class I SAM-dependent methyltransferase [Campylobacterota bacterium]|nr:class I SAM-dependent methyltransferase [Campylobacterota bacterium]
MECLVCNTVCHDFMDEKMGLECHFCPFCKLIFKSPKQFSSLAIQKERYDLHENEESDKGYQAYFQRFLDFVLPLVGGPKSALDFGCGSTSLLSKMLNKEGIKCDYYDPIYHPDLSCRQKNYDLIISTEVFEHLHNPKEVFELLLSQLSKGGYLAIQTQFHDNSVEHYLSWYYRQDPTHIVFFAPETFRVLCEMFGCEVVGDNGKNMVVIQKGFN